MKLSYKIWLAAIVIMTIAAWFMVTNLEQRRERSLVEQAKASSHFGPQDIDGWVKIEDANVDSTHENEHRNPTQAELWNTTELRTCKSWIAQNLDLRGLDLSEFHVDVVRVENNAAFVQFAHRDFFADIISEHGIEAIDGGFPYYFTIGLNIAGTKVTNHYAASE